MSAFLLLLAVGAAQAQPGPAATPEAAMTLELDSPAFRDREPIPARFTCDGDDVSPALAWRGAPAGTRSFALIMDDPDAPAGTWDHWLAYDLPAGAAGLPAAIPATEALPGGGKHGRNSWGRSDYGGPCPPGGEHRYIFRLYALDAVLGLPAGARKQDLLAAMRGHVLAEAQLLGTYRRR